MHTPARFAIEDPEVLHRIPPGGQGQAEPVALLDAEAYATACGDAGR